MSDKCDADLSRLLVKAVERDDVTSASEALDQGADVNSRDGQDQNKRTVLMRACSKGSQPICRALLEKGADVSLTNTNGESALMWAAAFGHVDIAQLLIEAKADINQQNNDGDTALYKAALWGKDGVVKLLLEQNVDASIVNKALKRAKEQERIAHLHRDPGQKERCRRIVELLERDAKPSAEGINFIGVEFALQDTKSSGSDESELDDFIDAVVACGQDRWYTFGRKLRVDHSRINAVTADKPDHASKLYAIIEEKRMQLGNEALAGNLKVVCEQLEIQGAVMDRMKSRHS